MTIPIEDRVEKAKQTIADLAPRLEELLSEREDLERSLEQIQDEIAEVDAEANPIRVRLTKAEAVLQEAAKHAGRQLELFS